MTYKGSKSKYAKYIAPIINKYIKENNITTFIDCFCGGANLVDKIECDTLIANDLSPTLIALHRQAQIDFSAIPLDGTKAEWDKYYTMWKEMRDAKDAGEDEWANKFTHEELYKMGAMEWYASFSRGGFVKGYARNTPTRNYYDEGRRNHEKQAGALNYQKINFIQGDYRDTAKLITDNTLFYCDSPYRGTDPYGIEKKFNFDDYYSWLRETSKKCHIFISEQEMPDDFPCVWSKDSVIRTNGLDNNYKACEKLFLI